MEETLQLILLELKELKVGQARLDGRMDHMESQMGGIKGQMGSIEGRMGSIEGRMEHMENELQEVKILAKATYEQVGMLTEFRAETIDRRDRIESKIDEHGRLIDILAARSIHHEADIVALKLAK